MKSKTCFLWTVFIVNVFVQVLAVKVGKAQKEKSACQLLQHVFQFDLFSSSGPTCPPDIINRENTIYLLYDVNQSEGFNLRRDVYIRLAVFVQKLQKTKLFQNIRLVLPPWHWLYHWKSRHLQQANLPWNTFFDMESLKRYAPVLDFEEFLEETFELGLQQPQVRVDKVFQLMHFKEMFENGVFHDKFEFIESGSANDTGICQKEKFLNGQIFRQSILLNLELICVRFQGTVSLLGRLLRHILQHSNKNESDVKVYAFLNAEIVLHDHWGGHEFWRARRSMRFAAPLVKIANNFRLMRFNSTDIQDKVQRPPMWEYEKLYRKALGGKYLCAHLRRGDFVHGREKTTPTLKSAATQIKHKLNELNLTQVFLATDANAFEVKNLKSYLQHVRLIRFSAESLEQKSVIKDGGIAIIDQLICAHAQYFIGTYESTFTYRIYEEREILGFPKSTTFNTFCKSESLENCLKNSIWPIVY